MKKSNFDITFAITVCDEHRELTQLLKTVNNRDRSKYKSEIVVQYDESRVTDEVLNVLDMFEDGLDTVYGFSLAGDFSRFKNRLFTYSTGEWIFQIDADEYPTNSLLNGIWDIIQQNKDVDVIRVSRLNFVNGITHQYIEQCGWNITKMDKYVSTVKEIDEDFYDTLKLYDLIIKEENGSVTFFEPIINWPDLQWRLYRNVNYIRWENKVHEVLVGADMLGVLVHPDFSLVHKKTIDRQIKQNEFYKTIHA